MSAGIDRRSARELVDPRQVVVKSPSLPVERGSGRDPYAILGRGPVHPFPARMAPSIAVRFLANSRRPLDVLDPMSGSGTVVAVATSLGHRAIGVDIDPLAVLISRVWSTPVDVKACMHRATLVLARARRRLGGLRDSAAYPHNADDETREFVRFWFDKNARRQLAALATEIRSERIRTIREVLWCAFSRLIITKQAGVSLAKDVSHGRPHRAFAKAPYLPFTRFCRSVGWVLKNCVGPAVGKAMDPPALRVGDARSLPLGDESIDLVVTSPPYLNAIDYLRASKFSLVWMGYRINQLRKTRAVSIGTEAAGKVADRDQEAIGLIRSLRLLGKFDTRTTSMIAKYCHDTRCTLRELYRVMRPRARAVLIVGENSIRGNYVPSARLVAEIARVCGLELKGRTTRRLPASRRYLPPPRLRRFAAPMDKRVRREVVLEFVKAPQGAARPSASGRAAPLRLNRRPKGS